MSPSSRFWLLHQLAHRYGLQTAYYDVFHQRRQASAEALRAMLHALGAPVTTARDVSSAWREQHLALWRRSLEPVIVVRNSALSTGQVRLPATIADEVLVVHLKLESGETRRLEWHGNDLPILETAEIEGTRYVVKPLPLPSGLPWGYHRLTLELPGKAEEALLISAPGQAYAPLEEMSSRNWGVFLPLYALHTKKSWGGGDLSDLESLMSWVSTMGGQVIATLPLLATFTDENSEMSPYLPISRCLWNEFYLDITRVPELSKCPCAQELLTSSSLQKEIRALRRSSLVDYARQMAIKRQILKELSRGLFAEKSDRLEHLQRFVANKPAVADYARFRATLEKQNLPWRFWSAPSRDGKLRDGDYDEENKRYHLYVQWLAHEQIQSLSSKAREKGVKLYLDLPLGVHPDGYDAWREREAFILNVSAGAPPDAVFTKGQNWEFPPLHPQKIREQGYQYVINYLRHHLQHAGILRIDHVMGLHRLFCIPDGLEASQGVYLRYPAEELYAILALESYRHQAIIVGEDLGTVSPEVRPAMRQHGLHRLHVLQYEFAGNHQAVLRSAPTNSIASLNTHDMFPFTTFWQGQDIKTRRKLGLLNRAEAKKEEKTRQAVKKTLTIFFQRQGWIKNSAQEANTALKACLAFLSHSRARTVLVNLEDLWGETRPQNIPSTRKEYPNWRRKARRSFEEFCQMPQLLDTLRMVNNLRREERQQK